MSYEYQKNNWESYDDTVDISRQPDAIITKKKLDKMEAGIERASMTFEIGNITTDNEEPSASITIDEFSHTRKLNIAFPKAGSGGDGGDSPSINDNSVSTSTTWSSDKLDEMFNTINGKIEEMTYEAIEIISFSNNLGNVEKGTSYEVVTFAWSINKTPTTLSLNGELIDASLKTLRYPTTVTSNTTFTLRATDEKGSTSTKRTTITFLNGIYYGASTLKTINDINSDFILSLTKSLASSYKKTFTVNPGADEYIYFAYPTNMGTPNFYVGGFEGGFETIGTLEFTNAHNYTENYTVYVSSNANLGSTTVEVK